MEDEFKIKIPQERHEVNRLVKEQLEERERVIGRCTFCKEVILGKNLYGEERAVYDPETKKMVKGVFHNACINKQYAQTVNVLISEVKSAETQLMNIIELVKPSKKEGSDE